MISLAVITVEPAITYSFCFGIIQVRLSGQYNACCLIYNSFADSHIIHSHFFLHLVGKTAAFMLPILERLLYRPQETPVTRVLVLTPTRELAIQVQYFIYGRDAHFHQNPQTTSGLIFNRA